MSTYIHLSEGDYLDSSPAEAIATGAQLVAAGVAEAAGDDAGKAFSEKFSALDSPAAQLTALLEQEPLLTKGHAEAEEKKDFSDRLEALFGLCFMLLSSLKAAEQPPFVAKILAQLAADKSDGQKRLRFMMTMYNTVAASSPDRPVIFKSLLTYASDIEAWETILPYCALLGSWMEDWKLPRAQRLSLFLTVAELYQTHGLEAESLATLQTCVKLYEADGDEKEGADAALKLVCQSLSAPRVVDVANVLAYRAVRALGSTKNSKLIDLLGLFKTGDFHGLVKFKAANVAVFEQHGISYESCESKMKLLTLSTLASSGSELALSAVAAQLDLSEEEAEKWVVRAVSAGMLDARLDQPRRVVMVKSVFKRTFENDE
jgi:translation initiation factor 3 subunit M